MRDLAQLTPEESFKAGLPIVLQLEAWIDREDRQFERVVDRDARLISLVRRDAYRDALALVTAKDADRDLDQ